MTQNSLSRLLTYRGIPVWRDIRVLQAVSQVVSAIIVVAFVVFFVGNFIDAANKRGLSLGFDFLDQEAGFPIAESVIGYDEADSFRYAFGVGLSNTLKVALIGIVAATVLGTIVGLARLSSNWLIRKIAGFYIETIRNVPLLIQLFFWYFAVFQALPLVKESIHWPGPVYLNNRGIYMVWTETSASFGSWILFVAGGLVVGVVLWLVLSRIQDRTGRPTYPLLAAFLAVLALPVVGWFLVGESPLTRDIPVLGRFNFAGGLRFTPEFTALLVGLVVYTATFIAEIVRAGVLAVDRGQVEAARAVGLGGGQTLRYVVFPQAMRVIVPPLISQYLNLTKNSSLAIAIGYPDLFAVSRIMINQAGRAVPIFLLVMVSYLAMSLVYAGIGNLYARRVRIVER